MQRCRCNIRAGRFIKLEALPLVVEFNDENQQVVGGFSSSAAMLACLRGRFVLLFCCFGLFVCARLSMRVIVAIAPHRTRSLSDWSAQCHRLKWLRCCTDASSTGRLAVPRWPAALLHCCTAALHQGAHSCAMLVGCTALHCNLCSGYFPPESTCTFCSSRRPTLPCRCLRRTSQRSRASARSPTLRWLQPLGRQCGSAALCYCRSAAAAN